MKKIGFCAVLLVFAGLSMLVSGCATIDLEGVKNDVRLRVDPISITDPAKFDSDVNECALLASNVYQDYQQKAIGGAIGGALLGAALGAAVGGSFGRNRNFVGSMAAAGAVVGGVEGVAGTPNWYNAVIGNCLLNRGYRVLY